MHQIKRPPERAAQHHARSARTRRNYSTSSPSQVLLANLKNVRRTGADSWRTDCPNPVHDRGRGMLSVTDRDGVLLLHCHGCHDTPAILKELGLTLADLYERPINPTPEQRRVAQQAAKRSGWAAALRVLDDESLVVLLAGCEIANGMRLVPKDHERLVTALERIHSARRILA